MLMLSTLTAQTDKISQMGAYSGYTVPEYKGSIRTSYYIPTRDSNYLATDVYLPKKLPSDKKIPALLYLTRYVRSLEPVGVLKPFIEPTTVMHRSTIDFYTSYGYAVVVVDVRGSGASSGNRSGEFTQDEIEDGNDVLNWIEKQPWSDGKVGATGISYLGTSALLLASLGHPALKCVAPRSAIWDMYTDVTHPGGIRQKGFLQIWCDAMQKMDRNEFKSFGLKGRLVKGINPVNGDRKRMMKYIQQRRNFDVYDEVSKVRFRNDTSKKWGRAIDETSPHRYADALNKHQVPMYIISGWYDGGVIQSSLDMFRVLFPQSKLLIGPWDHAQLEQVSPFAPNNKVDFNIKAELLRFYDYHLKGVENGLYDEPKSHLFIMGAEKWFGTDCNTPMAMLCPAEIQSPKVSGLGFPNGISEKIPLNVFTKTDDCKSVLHDECNELTIKADSNAFSGYGARWHSMIPLYRRGPIGYWNRDTLNKSYLTLISEPLKEDRILFDRLGLQTAPIQLIQSDLTLFAYLEERTADNQVFYITEGMKWLNHPDDSNEFSSHHYSPTVSGNKIIPFLPTGYLVKAGSRLQITLTTADREHFEQYTPHHQTITFITTPEQSFQLLLETLTEKDFIPVR